VPFFVQFAVAGAAVGIAKAVRTTPAADDKLTAERDRVAHVWVHKAFPEWQTRRPSPARLSSPKSLHPGGAASAALNSQFPAGTRPSHSRPALPNAIAPGCPRLAEALAPSVVRCGHVPGRRPSRDRRPPRGTVSAKE
jgi:hypothetical protein